MVLALPDSLNKTYSNAQEWQYPERSNPGADEVEHFHDVNKHGNPAYTGQYSHCWFLFLLITFGFMVPASRCRLVRRLGLVLRRLLQRGHRKGRMPVVRNFIEMKRSLQCGQCKRW